MGYTGTTISESGFINQNIFSRIRAEIVQRGVLSRGPVEEQNNLGVS